MRVRPVLFASALTLAVGLSFACTRDDPAPTPVADAGVDAEAAPAAEAGEGQPKIASDEATFEFGTIAPGKTIDHVFTIKNTGTADLVIDRVQKT